MLISLRTGIRLLALLLLASCNPSGEKVSISLQDSVTLQVRIPIPKFCPAMFCYEKGQQRYLLVDDKENYGIRVFDLVAKQEVEPVHIHDTGTNAIPHYFGFVVKTLDSIYLPGPDRRLYCINRSGDIIKVIDFSDVIKVYPLFTFPLSISRFTKGAVIKGNEIYFLQEDNRRYYFNHRASDYHFLLRYDIKHDSFGISPISLPDDFWKNGKREMSIFLTYNDQRNEFVFGTKFSDLIYTSRDGKTISGTYHSRSKAIREYYPYGPSDDLNSKNYFYSLCKYSYNVGLIWDPYRQIYYRFVWPGANDLDENQNGRVSEIYNNFPTFTIEVLDNEFNTLASYPLPENKYNWNNYFITREGLFLAVNNPPKQRMSLNWMFHIFKVRRLS